MNSVIKINFVFLRHGESCQNLIGSKVNKKDVRVKLYEKYLDPVLSENGKIFPFKLVEV